MIRLNDDSRRRNDQTSESDAPRRSSGGSHSGATSGRLRHMTAMLLTESFTTLVLTCPLSWYLQFTEKYEEGAATEKDDDANSVAMNRLLFSVFFYLLYSNKCVNFFLYLVSGHKFRLALRQLLRCPA